MECIDETIKRGIIRYVNSSFAHGDEDEDEEECYVYDLDEERLNEVSFVNDYILICFILGNDFLPHFTSVDLRREGMELVIEKYIETFCEYDYETIIIQTETGVKFNNDMFADFIAALASDEYTFFVDKLRKFMNREKRYSKCWDSEPYKVAIWKVENLIGEVVDDDIMLGIGEERDWKFRYYRHMGSEEHQDEFKGELCDNYLEGIAWVAKYYMESCDDYRWQFEYTHPPLLSDLAKYIRDLQKKKRFDMNSYQFNKVPNVPIFVQLLSVLPPKFNTLLPKSYRKLTTEATSQIIDMYPEEYHTDKLYKSRLYQCVPLIPNINVDRVLDSVKRLKLTRNEKELSELHEDPYQELI
jgi:5'-3' exonuclease